MDTTLKQRLIGAAVLVALAVIFLPMLVQGPAPDSGVADVSTRVPDAPAGGYETRELPLLGPAADTPVPAPETAAVAEEDAAPATPAADPATAAGRWAVSFGAYASERDAEAVISRLRQAGLDGFSEEDTVNGRQAWRVRVGPYADRALAEAGRLRAVRIRNDVNAQVIALDAADGEGTQGAAATAATQATAPAPAQATAASEPLPAREAPRTVSTTTTTAPATSSPAAASTSTASTRTATTQPQAPKATATIPAASRPATPAQPPAATVPAPSPTPAASNVGFAGQMGAFPSEADAIALRDRLRAAGFSAIVQPVRTDKGTLSRVRVGPVATRAEAEQLRGRLAAHGGGMVVPHP
ncbi:SPOR domain-containing protein [Pseudoxanthomonas suwonensis]|uniref:SPOR domain-containing protein n=1 Tax=Pseudoxanthomonas suwonensis TaxID=314722 RepID=UPI00138F72C9|nr:SPOR domain-containing protein [Pseudoxanthomonas suwonensis]KAF1705515.1 sporulation protein [Pseudoxanthomonas suwonensis]